MVDDKMIQQNQYSRWFKESLRIQQQVQNAQRLVAEAQARLQKLLKEQ